MSLRQRLPRLPRSLLACVPLLAAACAAPEAARPADTLIVGAIADIDAWNPYTVGDATSAGLLDLLYPRLFLEIGRPDGTVELEPWLARSWSFSEDRRTLEFRLRPEARWSNGMPVSCADVVFTHRIQRAPELAWAGAPLKKRILEVTCPDDHTARFRFAEVYADQLLDANDDAIVPAAYGAVPLSDWHRTAWETRAITCGPFRLVSVVAGQEAVLERDPLWWDAEAVTLRRVVVRVFPDSTVALARFLGGELDLLPKIPPLHAAQVEGDPGSRLVELPSLAFVYLGFNTLEPGAYAEARRARGCRDGEPCPETIADLARLRRQHPHRLFADPRVRRALSLAVDRRDIVEGLWAGHARPGATPLLSTSWAHDPDLAVPHDPSEARRLLEAAGWSAGADGVRARGGIRFEFSLVVNAENRVRVEVAERLAAQLRPLGVRVAPEPLPRAAFVARARDKDFDAILGGWWVGTRVEPQNLLHSHAALDRGNNVVSWWTEASDRLLDQAAAAPERGTARPLWHAWERVFLEEQPLAVLYEETRLLGVHARVEAPFWSFLNPFHELHRVRIRPDADAAL